MNQAHILMCPPYHFKVGYVINPWMEGHAGQVNKELALAQWQNLHDAISEQARVSIIEPVVDCPDLVFTANAGVTVGNKAIVSRFYNVERQAEEPYFDAWFKDNGYECLTLPEDLAFEGAGDALLQMDEHGAPSKIFAGYGFRTDRYAHKLMQRFFDIEVVSLHLVDTRFYHIDTCFCPLSNGYVLYHSQAFGALSLERIHQAFPEDKRIEVNVRDAGQFACNAINIGQHIFVHAMSDTLRARLEEAGFIVHTIALNEFLKAGGSAKCLTLRLTQ